MRLRYIRCLLSLAFPAAAAGQAALEYAAKSSANSVSAAGHDLHMGVCNVDASLLGCMQNYYPLTFKITAVGVILMLLVAVVRTQRFFR